MSTRRRRVVAVASAAVLTFGIVLCGGPVWACLLLAAAIGAALW